MKTLLMTATAGVLALAALAAPAQAATVFATTTTLGGSNFTWTNNGGASNTGTGGTLTGSGSTSFSFENLNPVLNLLTFLPANFSFSASTTGSPAVFSGAPNNLWTENGLNGSFSYTFAGTTATTINGITLTPGENLLSGTFTGAWIQGAGGSGSTNLSIGNGGHLTYTSAVAPFVSTGVNDEFAYTLLNVTPTFSASAGAALRSFTAKGDGEFSFASVGVPEPGTWALMILGFGGMGAMLRSRRRQEHLAA